MKNTSIKAVSKFKVLIAFVFLLLISSLSFYQYSKYSIPTPIRIGILHSLSGTMARSEKPLVDVLLMGVDELNAKGGLLGRPIETIVVDSRSDWEYSAREAERLIVEEKVDVIFGCWTSSCRKAVKPIVEKYNHLLFYSVQYEGLEQSPNIVYTGATPNQQIIPGVMWSLDNLGKRIYLLGSDYVFPHTANFIIHDVVNIKNAEIIAERYLPLGSDDFDNVIAEIKNLRPDVILNTINGDSNQYFFSKKHQAGLDDIPVVSFSVAEPELSAIPEARIETHYAVWSYFQSIDNVVNNEFVRRVKQKLGAQRVIGEPMEMSYMALHFWAQTVRSAESVQPEQISKIIGEQSLNSPEGIISIDGSNHHLRKKVRIGRARPDGHFDIIWELDHAISPVPFPTYRSRNEWHKIVKNIASRGDH
ncbi:MAG: urea ABC transporter substrate-binding protein [Gammaproteobacteria bacterium]|nr:urea ABC transporter substrate-binding protein [Gammaproteobacteria bacterium]